MSIKSKLPKKLCFFEATPTRHTRYHRNPQKAHLGYGTNVLCKFQPDPIISSIKSDVHKVKIGQKPRFLLRHAPKYWSIWTKLGTYNVLMGLQLPLKFCPNPIIFIMQYASLNGFFHLEEVS